MLKQFDRWHHTKIGLFTFSVIELAIAYGFSSLAIDRGNLWWYILALIFLVGGLQNIFKFLAKVLKHA